MPLKCMRVREKRQPRLAPARHRAAMALVRNALHARGEGHRRSQIGRCASDPRIGERRGSFGITRLNEGPSILYTKFGK